MTSATRRWQTAALAGSVLKPSSQRIAAVTVSSQKSVMPSHCWFVPQTFTASHCAWSRRPWHALQGRWAMRRERLRRVISDFASLRRRIASLARPSVSIFCGFLSGPTVQPVSIFPPSNSRRFAGSLSWEKLASSGSEHPRRMIFVSRWNWLSRDDFSFHHPRMPPLRIGKFGS